MTGTAQQPAVASGLWWNGGTWTLRSVPPPGGSLPETGTPWRRVPGWVLFPLAPVVGGVFVVALPVVGALLVAQAIGRRLLAGGGLAARHLATAVIAPGPSPGLSHLAGSPGEPPPPATEAAGAAPPAVAPLDELEAEVRRARAPGKPG
jgi:hypothetical protein